MSLRSQTAWALTTPPDPIAPDAGGSARESASPLVVLTSCRCAPNRLGA